MTIYYLYRKTHMKTGLQYLGKTEKDPYLYKGSGLHWKRHLKKHGNNVETVVLNKCYSKESLKSWGLFYSGLWSVTRSKKWANLRDESGDGGDTSQTPNYISKRHLFGTNPPRGVDHKGPKNANYDPTVFQFKHTDGKVETCTRYELCTKYNLKSGGLSGVISAPGTTHYGWYIGASPIGRVSGSRHHLFDHNVYTFVHCDGLLESSTRFDLMIKYPHLRCTRVSLLCRGLIETYKGWSIM